MTDEPLESNREIKRLKKEGLINSGWSRAEREALPTLLLTVIFQFVSRSHKWIHCSHQNDGGLGFKHPLRSAEMLTLGVG